MCEVFKYFLLGYKVMVTVLNWEYIFSIDLYKMFLRIGLIETLIPFKQVLNEK